MILVADSGSSKADWIIIKDDAERIEFSTKGINPFFSNEKEICKVLSGYEEVQKYNSKIKEVHFFGAGCSSPDKREIVSNGLSKVFSKAFINVEDGVLGAVYATCGNSKGFTCVLGTGSNIAFFDGEQAHYGVHGIGYILGDEGSGAYFGRKIITAYMYGLMPQSLKKAFEANYQIDKETIIENIYQKPSPNIYLAAFSRFMYKHRDDKLIQSILFDGFEEFAKVHILRQAHYQAYPCHFVGSIAYFFQDVLAQVCSEHKIKLGKVIASPINGLTEFILNKDIDKL
ncbi:N-acetylglucosamine kinase [Paradesertivirga mongoliensis]|uniref:N-acetylglucosamine kinase n=1 Tax=Paradesertivirga mongoliensis TaxID=2100740 RepID=A0ABW4ZJ67_9SPHI|nr:N-acetylglucosamine kinase [Pedobacter mongoliensis]